MNMLITKIPAYNASFVEYFSLVALLTPNLFKRNSREILQKHATVLRFSKAA